MIGARCRYLPGRKRKERPEGRPVSLHRRGECPPQQLRECLYFLVLVSVRREVAPAGKFAGDPPGCTVRALGFYAYRRRLFRRYHKGISILRQEFRPADGIGFRRVHSQRVAVDGSS